MALDTGIRMEEDAVDVPEKAAPPAAPKPAPKLFSNRIIVRTDSHICPSLQIDMPFFVLKCQLLIAVNTAHHLSWSKCG